MITTRVFMESKKIVLQSGLDGNTLTLVFDSKKSIKDFVRLVDKHCETIAVPAYIVGIGQMY